jgi:uncharacterized protein (TIGR03437 family)
LRKLTPVLLFLSFVFSAHAQQFINGQAARAVIGQVNFTVGNSLQSNVILGGSGGVAYDAAHHSLYVADSNRLGASANGNADTQTNRVLVFNTSQVPAPHDPLNNSYLSVCYLCGYPASLSLGQPSFTPTDSSSGTAVFDPGLAATSTSQPYLYNASGVGTDGKILAVADTDNNRVLIWTSLPTSMNQLPNLVLGQPDLSTRQSPGQGVVSSTIMRGPQGVWVSNNHLFVADTSNNRILIWNSIPTVNNQPPDVELGQPDFNHANAPPVTISGNPNAAPNELLSPTSVTSDGTHVFVTDLGFNRVLIWNSLPTANGQNADVEIGQPDMIQTVSNDPNSCGGSLPIGPYGACQANLSFPRFALPDGNGRLFIADGGNDRVLIYNSIPTLNGASADGVLGQPDFVNDLVSSAAISIASTAIDNTGAVDVTPSPTSLAWDGTNLYVADPFNRRVLMFSAGDQPLYSNQYSNPPIYSIVNWASETVRQEGLVQFSLVGGIVANDTATITVQSVAYTYTIKSTDTVDTIAQAIVALINKTDTNVTASFAGFGSGTVYLSSKNVGVAYDTITLSATTSNTADILATASGGYLTAGNAATGAPGMLIEVDAPPGTSFTDSSGILTPAFNGDPLPTTLGGVQLSLDGVASPLLKVSKTQIVGQIPYYFTDRNSTSVYVRTQHADGSATVTNAAPIYIAPANPGIFNAPSTPTQPRPWPASQAYHQPGNPTAVVSIDGSVNATDVATLTINGTAYNYTVVASDTLLTIAQSLISKINSAPDPNVTASLGGAFDRIILTARQPGAAGTGITVAGSASTNANVTVTAYSGTTCCNVTPGSLITAANPAGPGELITVNAAGLGPLVDTNGAIVPVITGSPYPSTSAMPNSASNFVAATMGGVTAQVIGAGFEAGSYGVYSVQMVVPTSLTPLFNTQLYIAQNAFISNTVTIAVGNPVPNAPPAGPTPTPSPITNTIDYPAANSTASGVIPVQGWSVDANAPITGVKILVDGNSFGTVTYGGSRPDVCALYPGSINCPNVGWTGSLDTTSLPNGAHSFQATATDANGVSYTSSSAFTVANDTADNPTHAYIDVPGSGYTYHGALTFSGWAINDSAAISSVQVYVDGALRGPATYGGSRTDVCAAYPGRAGCPNVGWSYFLDTSALADGTHSFSISAIAANGQKVTIANSFIVANHATGNPAIITIDTPGATSGTFSGTATFGGWALDANSVINSVTLAVDGVVYGAANFNLTRTDVCTALPGYPGCPNVGWNAAIDTTQLADGTHTLSVTANPNSGQSFTTSTTFSVANLGTAANPVRISIDSPANGSTVSGIAGVAGWAVSDNAAISNVQVLVDGVLKGTAVYGWSRPDVCTALGTRPGCPNVGWGYVLNTTQLSDGTHTLAITATTASGERATSSSPFMVLNGAAANSGPGRIAIDSPNVNSNPFNGVAQFYGWAINDNSAVASVSYSVDGVPYGNANYGAPRPDVCAVFPGRAGCPNVGWGFTLDTTRFADGVHTLGITEVMTNGTFFTSSSTFTVGNWSAANPMQITIDSPSVVAPQLFGSAVLHGWVVNSNVIIAKVTIAVDGVPFGDAAYGQPRPDVCSVFASANCPNVGWSYTLDTTLLPDGQHTLAVTGVTASGQTSTGTAVFDVVN